MRSLAMNPPSPPAAEAEFRPLRTTCRNQRKKQGARHTLARALTDHAVLYLSITLTIRIVDHALIVHLDVERNPCPNALSYTLLHPATDKTP